MIKNALSFILYLIVLMLIPFAASPTVAHALPIGFKKEIVSQGFNMPTTFVNTPDGRIFVAEKNGLIKVIKNNQILSTPLLSLPVYTEGEAGISGLAIDPNFSSNNYIYVYYVNNNPLEIHLSRFVVSGDIASATSETILLKQPVTFSIHFAGTIRFSPDGKLFVSIGDNARASNGQKLDTILGKIIRINKDGSIPQDNPFVGQLNKRPEIWAYGFRNPFRFHLMPDGSPIVADVGQDAYEEVNIVTKGGNYGWSLAEGPCMACAFINPIFSYAHNGESASISGGPFYKSTASSSFPVAYQNSYFYGDYARGFIRRLTFDSQGNFAQDLEFDPEAGAAVDFFQGNDGSLYFLTIYTPGLAEGGTVYRIRYTGGNVAPTAKISASPLSGKTPLIVDFSSNGSFDPEGKTLTYEWKFGDGETSRKANPSHKYRKKGTYKATLQVSDGVHKSDTVEVTIVAGNEGPTATIVTPSDSFKYNAGQTISYSGRATDPETGDLPSSKFSWLIVFHHDTHTHPFLGPINGVKSGTFTIPTNGEPSSDTWYEVQLTVTDNANLSHTVSKTINPNKSTLTIGSTPTAMQFTFNGQPQVTPFTFESVVGFTHTLDVVSPQSKDGKNYTFVSWSDSKPKLHDIIAPSTNTTYTFSLAESQGKGNLRFRVPEFDTAGARTGVFINGATAKLTDVTGNTIIQTTTSQAINNQDGWVRFDNIQEGNYGVLVYKVGLPGIWRQTECSGAGTTQNATIQNIHSEGLLAGWQSPVTITANQITYCRDIGLKNGSTGAQTGNLYFRVREFDQQGNPTGKFVNGATAKLLNAEGIQVAQPVTSTTATNGQEGWVFFNTVPQGSYTVVTYKEGLKGHWRQTECSGVGTTDEATIQNQQTDNIIAALQKNVAVTPGQITWCKDAGLKL